MNLEAQFGSPVYQRSDAPASRAQKEVLKNLSPDQSHRQGIGRRTHSGQADQRPG